MLHLKRKKPLMDSIEAYASCMCIMGCNCCGCMCGCPCGPAQLRNCIQESVIDAQSDNVSHEVLIDQSVTENLQI